MNIARAKRIEDLRKDAERFLPALPFRGGAQQILLGHHLENGADVLRHAAVHEHEANPASAAAPSSEISSRRKDVMARHEAPAGNAMLRIALARRDALDQLDSRPDAAGILPAAAGAADPFAEQRAGEHEPAFAFLQAAR